MSDAYECIPQCVHLIQLCGLISLFCFHNFRNLRIWQYCLKTLYLFPIIYLLNGHIICLCLIYICKSPISSRASIAPLERLFHSSFSFASSLWTVACDGHTYSIASQCLLNNSNPRPIAQLFLAPNLESVCLFVDYKVCLQNPKFRGKIAAENM